MSFQGMQGHLATITSSDESNFISANLPAACTGGYWLGGFQDRSAPDYSEPAGGWRWVTGETWNFTFWSAGEPNNQFGIEDYLLFRGFADCTWNDGRTNDFAPRGFLVEFVPPCQVNQNDINLFAGGPYSLDGKNTSMNATFVPKDAGDIPVGLSVAAAACGFSDFNWQQEIDFLPAPSTWRPFTPSAMNEQNLSPDGSLQAPPPFSDPPPGGGYTYENGNDSAFPFYWDSNELATGLVPCAGGTRIKTITALSFQDCPGDSLLPRGAAVQFKTSLVGIRPCPVGATGCQTGIPSDPLYSWKWKTTFNGISNGGVSQSKSIFPIDPTSGTGGITITSVNGVPQMPPSLSCTASPNTLWPPNGKSVLVTVSGNVTPGTQAIIPGSSVFTVADSQREAQPSGSITVGSDGSYSFTVSLVASRDGSNQNGRQYTIAVSASDQIGNVGSCSTVVTVRHDQGH
jgi:hypothetical protein